ncbi:MAG: spermidine synthase [Stappiaceae bacterium]
MSAYFKEIAYCPTPIGVVSLRRRRILSLDQDVFEILLDDEHLMSSLFITSEIALANLALAELEGNELDIVVGGLGLGYTARAVLDHDTVGSLTVVEMLEPVVAWHEDGLLPLEPGLAEDPRCKFVCGDFFSLAQSAEGFDRKKPGRRYHAILIDIDHTPERLLDQRSQNFYSPEGYDRLANHLHPGGIVGLWSDEEPDEAITNVLGQSFSEAWAAPVVFANPLQDNRPVTQTVYLARKAGKTPMDQ